MEIGEYHFCEYCPYTTRNEADVKRHKYRKHREKWLNEKRD